MAGYLGPNTLQSAVSATGNGIALNVHGMSTGAFQVTGTFSATITFEGTIDETNWVSLNAVPLAGGAVVSTATATGVWVASCAGLAQVRARVTWTSGTSVTVAAMATSETTAVPLSQVLAAGTANIGDVDVLTLPTQGYGSSASVTRPANTNIYGAGDVVGAAAAAITFANATGGAGEYMITSVSFERDVAALIAGETSYTLHLYNVTPPSAFADEATWDLPSGDRASYLGSINLGTPVDLGSTLYVAQDGVNKQVTALSTSLFGYLVTVGTYTAASASVHVVAIHCVKV